VEEDLRRIDLLRVRLAVVEAFQCITLSLALSCAPFKQEEGLCQALAAAELYPPPLVG